MGGRAVTGAGWYEGAPPACAAATGTQSGADKPCVMANALWR